MPSPKTRSMAPSFSAFCASSALSNGTTAACGEELLEIGLMAGALGHADLLALQRFGADVFELARPSAR